MFQVLSGERKRRVITPTTVAASVAAHLLLLGGVVYAAGGSGTDARETVADTMIIWDEDHAPPEPKEAAPPPPAAVEDPAPPPEPGERLELHSPVDVPEGIEPESPDVKPVNPQDYLRDGRIGDVIGTPAVEPAQPTGNTSAEPIPDFVLSADDVEERPELDRSGLGRALERYYPTALRDSRVSGRVVIEVIVEENGRPRAGSARVLEASHPAFGEAALRAVDRFRFRPAKTMGVPVPVRVTIPIQWTAQ